MTTLYSDPRTEEEILDLLEEIHDANARGDSDRASELAGQIPVTPQTAIGLVEAFGKEYVQENFNLTRANVELGDGWIDRVPHLLAFLNE